MKVIIVIISILLGFQGLTAQEQEKEKPENRLLIGGGLGLQFGTITYIEVSPRIGYQITDHFSAGLGGTYSYFRDRRLSRDYSTDMWGARIFLQHDIYEDIFAYAEAEYMSYEGYDMNNNITRIGSENILLGGGYKQWVSRNAYVYLMLLYNINETIETPYSNPVFRTGVMLQL